MTTPNRTVTTPTDLTTLWTDLMGRDGFDGPTLWVVFFDDEGRLQPVVMPIDDIPPDPDAEQLDAFSDELRETLDEQWLSSAAFLVSRPGPPSMTPPDRAWARALLTLPDDRLRRWPVHLATRGEVRVFAPDDLIGAA